MKKKSKREIINNVADVLFSRIKPEDAVELRELCMLARVSEAEAFMAINSFIDDGTLKANWIDTGKFCID